MSRFERCFVYAALVALALVAMGNRSGPAGSMAQAAPSAAPAPHQPTPATIATCDIYYVLRMLVESDRYRPSRQAEQEKARAELKEIAEKIRSSEAQLKAMDPKDEKARPLFEEYNKQKAIFAERQAELDGFLGTQFVDAYEDARKAIDAVAERRGYSHVVASRRQDDKPSSDMDKITQAMLSRPMLRAPAADDITDDVLADLKL